MNEERRLERIAFDQRQYKLMLKAINLYKENYINLEFLYCNLTIAGLLQEVDSTYREKLEELVSDLDYLNECLTVLAYSDKQVKEDQQKVDATIEKILKLIKPNVLQDTD